VAGPFDIQRPPIGLLDLLGLKATGDAPHLLEQAISGSFEMFDLYTLDRLAIKFVNTVGAIAGVGNSSLPGSGPGPGSIWFVYGVDFVIPLVAAAASIQSGLYWRRQGSLLTLAAVPDCQSPLVAAAGSWVGAHWFERPMILRPGDEMSIVTRVFTGAPAVTASCALTYVDVTR
jgi:hypothetical protein